DIDAFAATVGRAFPENRILSHDLIEGNYARSGLVTDIELLDDFPARYHAYARREHRWIRGDWQLLPWLAPKVPLRDAVGGGRWSVVGGDAGDRGQESRVRNQESARLTTRHRPPTTDHRPLPARDNPLPLIERWKVFDNLRRSLVAPSVVALLVAAW